jgi:hypothetical protein
MNEFYRRVVRNSGADTSDLAVVFNPAISAHLAVGYASSVQIMNRAGGPLSVGENTHALSNSKVTGLRLGCQA